MEGNRKKLGPSELHAGAEALGALAEEQQSHWLLLKSQVHLASRVPQPAPAPASGKDSNIGEHGHSDSTLHDMKPLPGSPH